MILRDRELRGIIKQGLDEKRAVEAGRMTLEETSLPKGSYLQDGKVHLPPDGLVTAAAKVGAGVSAVGSLILVGLGVAMLFAAIRTILMYEVRGVALYLAIAVGVAALALGAVFYWARDVRRLLIAGIVEIGSGVTGGVIGFFATTDPLSRWVVLIAAAIAIADGVDKVVQSRRARTLTG